MGFLGVIDYMPVGITLFFGLSGAGVACIDTMRIIAGLPGIFPGFQKEPNHRGSLL
jgi:hypothetical protein